MKKVLSVILGGCLVAAFAVFASCSKGDSHKDLITGDFSAEATAVQRTQLGEALSSDSLWGDQSQDGWKFSIENVVYGYMDIDAVAMGESMVIDTDMDVSHLITLEKKDGALSLRGAGNMKMDMNMMGIQASYSGKAYNDSDYYYLDATVSALGQKQSVKQKMYLSEAMGIDLDIDENDLIGSFADLTPIFESLDDQLVKIYIDDSDEQEQKVKIAWTADDFTQYFEDILNEDLGDMSGVSIDMGSLQVANFGCCEYYVSLDKDTGILTGFGSKLDFTLGMSMLVEGTSIQYTFDYDLTSWVMQTEKEASLPSDLSGYEFA